MFTTREKKTKDRSMKSHLTKLLNLLFQVLTPKVTQTSQLIKKNFQI